MKQSKKFAIGFIFLLGLGTVALAVIYAYVQNNKQEIVQEIQEILPGTSADEEMSEDDQNLAQVSRQDISTGNLVAGQSVTLPYTVNGMVKGNWFFEGSFPVYMEDNAGNRLGFGLAGSTQDWMTVNSIPFSVTLPAITYQGPGFIVFTKDNPSGEAQFDDSYTVPVVFQ